MSRSRHTEAQIIGALKQLEAGRKAEDVAREVGVSKHTIYAWKAKYGGMDVSQAQEAKQLCDDSCWCQWSSERCASASDRLLGWTRVKHAYRNRTRGKTSTRGFR